MATPEQEFDSGRAMTTLVRVLSAGGLTMAGVFVWMYSQIFTFATWRADEEHYKEALSMRIETIEVQARLHLAGQHEATRRQRVKDVRGSLKRFEALSIEILRLVPGRSKNPVRRRLQEHRDRLTDSLIGD